ncbi:CoA-transferase [Rhodococcus hoagii]|nr:CoA-transferase [Prescottella equi]MBM4529565.1 CoA-transferase [Prescottella equi]MBM4547043.1 CoA-transferase [Prescottella equi]MBM4573864.1 CoA-transferase [Prescottella equi]MBM4604786.1 CoA-transferase [Prescottella equi]
MSAATRAEVCAVACAEAYRGNGEVIASAFGTIPAIGVRLARHTFEPDLVVSDGEAAAVRGTWAVGGPADGEVEAWLPFNQIFDLVWNGKRHIMMIPTQLDVYGNCNISAIGDHERPNVQLLGVRGAPGNTVYHPTSYWVPKHSTRVFVPKVDMVSGVGNDNARKAGPAATGYHELRRVVTDLAVLDFTPDTGRLRLVSVHPGVTVDDVVAATGFDLVIPDSLPQTRAPSAEELELIRTVIDPRNLRDKEVPA